MIDFIFLSSLSVCVFSCMLLFSIYIMTFISLVFLMMMMMMEAPSPSPSPFPSPSPSSSPPRLRAVLVSEEDEAMMGSTANLPRLQVCQLQGFVLCLHMHR